MPRNKKIKVSVIVPVYNPGDYFKRCIDSILNQTLKDIEIIFVDDCSTDGTIDIIKNAAKKDNRIKLIRNRKNTGSGIARNKGIDIATGEYLSFIDSDDYIADDYLQLLYEKAHNNKLDLIKGTNIYLKKDGTIFAAKNGVLNRKIKDGLKKSEPLYLLYTYEHHSSLYLRSFIIKNKIRYGSSRRCHDNTFLLQVCHQAKRFDLEEKAKYYFCERDDSIMHRIDPKQLYYILDSVIERIDYVLKNIKEDQYIKKYTSLVLLDSARNVPYYANSKDIKEIRDFTKCLKKQINRLPWKEELVNNSFSLKILDQYEQILPSTAFIMSWETRRDPVANLKLVEIWTDFLIKHPEEFVDGESRLFNLIYYSFIYSTPFNNDVDIIVKRKAARLLWKQIKRLNISQLCRLFLHMVSRAIKQIINRLKK